MQVKPTGDATRMDGVVKPNAAPSVPVAPVDATTPARRSDEVEISTAGVMLSGDQPVDPAIEAELGADRVADIRAKISSGEYLTLDAANQTARNIVRRGDL